MRQNSISKSKDLVIGTISNNLFDKTKAIYGKEVYGDGRILDNAKSIITDYIPITGDSIYISGLPIYADGLTNRYCYFYADDKTPIGTESSDIGRSLTEKTY